MSSIKNVALAGASGNVGSQVLHALLAQNFTVTILSRLPHRSPSRSRRRNRHDLFPGHRHPAPSLACIRALPVFARKKAAYEAVQRHAAASTLTYTVVACGVFLDWALSSGFAGLDFSRRKVRIFGTGDNVVPWATLEDVGRATAEVLLHPRETRNRAVYVHSVYLSQNQLVGVVKKVLGAEGWEETRERDMRGLLEGALADLREGREVTAATFEEQIQYCIATRELAYPWERDDSGLLEVREWGVEEVEGLVGRVAGGV